jgi:Fe-Mn family superoxide dismutase
MSIELPNLPYPYDALKPYISDVTLKTHHGKHHRAYVDKTNELVRGTDLAGATLEAIVKASAQRADAPARALFNAAAQAWNHGFYWNSLRPQGGRGPQGALAARIRAEFGNEEAFASAFKAAATGHFGSGWAWLAIDGTSLKIATTSNADTPIVHGQTPLLVLDVWEHAYYLDHQERRAAYVAGVVEHLLNWEFAGRAFERAKGRASPEPAAASPALR